MPSTEQQITTVLDQEQSTTTGRGLVQLMLVGLGIMVAFLGLRMGLSGGWSAASFHGPAVPLLPIVAGGLALAYVARSRWTRGRLRAARAVAAVSVVVLAGGIGVVANLPTDIFPGPPNWVLILAGALVFLVGLVMGAGPARTLDDGGSADPRRWSTRTQNLLRGRYGFGRSDAESTVEGFLGERDAAGTTGQPQAHPEVVAARLAAGSPAAASRTILLNRSAWLVAAVLWVGLLGVPQFVGFGATPAGALPLVIGVVVLAWSVLRVLPARRGADAAALLDRRRARARRIALALTPHA